MTPAQSNSELANWLDEQSECSHVDGLPGDAGRLRLAASRLREAEGALRSQKGWIGHWRGDRECGLAPTYDALDEAEAEIDKALAPNPVKTNAKEGEGQ
jgi:hypothetical protein